MAAQRTETADGHELCLATHVLGPLLLTELLLPLLAAAPDPRVVLMSSGGMYTQSLAADDVNTEPAATAVPPPTHAANVSRSP
jgi:NAD(P)-dependent dehydrogenase (short-subunit alcohol dehydrogenase family)